MIAPGCQGSESPVALLRIDSRALPHTHERYIGGETLAVDVGYESLGDEDLQPVTIDGRQLWIGVALA